MYWVYNSQEYTGAKSSLFYVTVAKRFFKLKNTNPPLRFLMLYEQPKEGINQKQMTDPYNQEIVVA